VSTNKVVCKLCKADLTGHTSLMWHYWNDHRNVALRVFAFRTGHTSKLNTFERIAAEGMKGHVDVPDHRGGNGG